MSFSATYLTASDTEVKHGRAITDPERVQVLLVHGDLTVTLTGSLHELTSLIGGMQNALLAEVDAA